jgi:serine/threonine protein kinase
MKLTPCAMNDQHNILISESGSALVADFDLIVLADSSLGRQTTDSGNRATDAFKAPERFNGQRRPTQECDVYAFACLCVTVSSLFVMSYQARSSKYFVQASTGCKPLYDTAKKDVWQLVGVEDKRPERPLASACMGPPISDDLWQLIESCWKTKPEERLTMQEVVAYFQRNMPP